MNILYVTPRYLPELGGVERHVAEVSRRIAAAGESVTVLTTDADGSLPPIEEAQGVTIRRARAWRASGDARWAPAVYRLLREGAWDVVHCQSYHTLVAPIAMIAARDAGIPYVLTFHGGGHSARWRNRIRGWQISAMRPLIARAERLVAVAQFEIELYRRYLRVPSDRFVWIPNGVDVPWSRQPLPASGPPWIVSVGRLERYKGHDRLIRALPGVIDHIPDVRLQIIGTGPRERHLRRLARRLGVSERVEIRAIRLGDRPALAEALARSSVFVLMSEFETHPIAALEAIAIGRPVLLADNSGSRELADQGLARTVPLDSTPERLATAIVEQLRSPGESPRLTLSTWDECSSRLLHLYSEVIAART
jgi:glycosyltransferase involved in cell wall biosynthesis